MGKSMGVGIDGADTEEIAADQKEGLMMEKCAELQSEQQKALIKEHSTEEKEHREELQSDVIKSIMGKWNEYKDFFEKYHPIITVRNRMLSPMDENMVSHFQRAMQHRKKTNDVRQIFHQN